MPPEMIYRNITEQERPTLGPLASLAKVGSHGGKSGPMAEVTLPCDRNHLDF